MRYLHGTIKEYMVSIDLIYEGKAHTVTGFGLTPSLAREDAESKLTKEERLFAYVRVRSPRKIKAAFKVPLSDVLGLKSCSVSDWVPDQDDMTGQA